MPSSPLRMVSCKSASASFSGTPSFAALFNALRKPCMTVSEFAPDVSSCPIMTMACSALSPISWNAVAFCTRPLASVSTDAPVACPVAVRASRIPSASSAPKPKADSAFCTVSTEPVTSVPFILANLINCVLSFSRLLPVNPKRVLTSPIAAPAVSKSVGMVVAMPCRMPCICSKLSPDAPVFSTMTSSPASTSFHDATAAAPAAKMGPVTAFVMAVPAFPKFLETASPMLLPAVLPAFSLAGLAASVICLVRDSCAPCNTGVTVIVA